MQFFFDWTLFFFPIAFFLAFVIPGTLLIFPLKLNSFETLTIGSGFGVALWAIQGFVFGLLGARQLTYVYLLIFIIVWIYVVVGKRKKLKNYLRSFICLDPFSYVLIFLGSILALSAVWFMGVKVEDGLFFCCRGVPDAVYHLSLTNELINRFPPNEPGMNGVLVKNYHYFSNLVVADISRIFKLDYIQVQFRYMSFFLTLILGFSAFVFAKLLGLKKVFSRWLVVLFFGSGDILYLLLFLRGKGLNFGTTILDDATKLFAGPPRADSIVLFFCGICLFIIWIKKRNFYPGLLCSIIFGTLVGFKIYTGLFALTGLAFVSLYFFTKKRFSMLIPVVIALFISLIYILIVNKGAGGLHFTGFWRFENFMLHKDLAISKLEYIRLARLQTGDYLSAVALEILFIAIFFTFLYGTVNLGLIQTKKSLKLFPVELNIFLMSAIIISLIAGSFFVQTTGAANTIQFIISVFIIGAIYTALSLYFWTEKVKGFLKIILIVSIFLLTLPRAFHEGAENLINIEKQRGFNIDNQTLNSLSYLKLKTPQNSKIIIDPWMSEEEVFMYITFLSDRPIFLSGAGVMRDHGQDTHQREGVVNDIYNSKNSALVHDLLLKNNINYIYLTKDSGYKNNLKMDFLSPIFENDKVEILKIVS